MKGSYAGWMSGLMLASALGTTAMARERAIQASALPAAVQQAIASQFPKAKAERYSQDVEHGKTEYEVVLRTGRQSTEVSFAPDGTVLSQEQRLAVAELPNAVRQALTSTYAQAKVLKAEKELKGHTTHYEVLVSNHGKKSELVFDAQGKQIQHESGQEDAD